MSKHERKVPFVAQAQKTECGLTCVCMINRYYKNYISMEELREKLEIGRDGSSFQQLIDLLEKGGFDVKCYNIPIDKLSLLPVPAIAFWGSSHFIIIEKVNKHFVTVVDPAIGRYKLSHDEVLEGYTGYAIVPRPNENFKTNKKKEHSWQYFIPYIFKNKALYIHILLMSLIVYSLTLGMPIIIQHIIDTIVQGNALKNNGIYWGLIVLISILS